MKILNALPSIFVSLVGLIFLEITMASVCLHIKKKIFDIS